MMWNVNNFQIPLAIPFWNSIFATRNESIYWLFLGPIAQLVRAPDS